MAESVHNWNRHRETQRSCSPSTGPDRAASKCRVASSVSYRPRSTTHLAERGPLLLTSGTEDHVVPLKVTKEVFEKYSKGTADTEFHVFEGKGHSLTSTTAGKRLPTSP